MSRCVLLLSLLWSLVEVNSQQTFPYVSFLGQNLANHSYVDLSLVGYNYRSGNKSVQCHTDLATCCSHTEGIHRGDWYFPNGYRLPFPIGGNIYEARLAQRVYLTRNWYDALSPSGIYRCDIATNDVHNYSDISVRDTVYVGLYTSHKGNKSPFEVMSSQRFVKCLSVDFSCTHNKHIYIYRAPPPPPPRTEK